MSKLPLLAVFFICRSLGGDELTCLPLESSDKAAVKMQRLDNWMEIERDGIKIKTERKSFDEVAEAAANETNRQLESEIRKLLEIGKP